MGPSEYMILKQPGFLFVEWMSPTFPIEIKVTLIGLLTVLPFLFIFRGPVTRFADRHMHIHWSSNVIGIGAPLISLLCGVFLFFVKAPEGLVSWEMDEQGIKVISASGKANMEWEKVESALVEPNNQSEKTLVLKSKEGQTIFLFLSWLEPLHQDLALSSIDQFTGHRFKFPVDDDSEEDEN
ncbi:MAG: hypothetical protein IPN90_01045 [Elusimicrobia bacterium]|nr:hypothetical protein [Elusimicrobiota bacterium]